MLFLFKEKGITFVEYFFTKQIVMTLKEWFLSNNFKDIKDTNMTWSEVGALFNLTGEAARSHMKRYWKENRAVKTTDNETLFEEFLAWKNSRLIEKNVEVVNNYFYKEGLHLVLGCWHVPFHNTKLTNNVLKLIEENKEDIVGFHLIGDFLDLNTLSSHDTGNFPVISGLTLDIEYKEGNKVLNSFDKILPPNIDRSFLYGNHEHRYNRYMANMQAAKTPISSPKEGLNLVDRGYNVLTNWEQDFVRLGSHLELIHGTYYNQYAAKKHIDVLRGSVAFSHTHRIQSYIEGQTGGFNIGCGIDLNSPAFNYASRAMKSQWQNGFATVYIDSDGNYYFNQIVAHNGQFVFNNKLYK